MWPEGCGTAGGAGGGGGGGHSNPSRCSGTAPRRIFLSKGKQECVPPKHLKQCLTVICLRNES